MELEIDHRVNRKVGSACGALYVYTFFLINGLACKPDLGVKIKSAPTEIGFLIACTQHAHTFYILVLTKRKKKKHRDIFTHCVCISSASVCRPHSFNGFLMLVGGFH